MDTDYKFGQPLVVELENETLVGNLKLISSNGRMVELTNVRDLHSGYIYTSPQCLPRPLIKSIKKCKAEKSSESVKSSTPEQQIEEKHAANENSVNITSNEIDQIQTVVAAVTYIFQTDQKYHKAIADIKHQSVIGLHVEPTEFGRHNRTSLLTVATSQNVYIFDLVSLGKLFKELENILNAQRPKKIVYYSNKLADNLKYQHGVDLTGAFDTFVAHCLISKEKSPISFVQCVIKYFNIPENYFEGENDLNKDIYKRPLPRTHLDVVAKKVIFLYKLYEHLLHNIMLKNFYKQCNDFSVAMASNKDNVEMVMQLKPDLVHGVDCIGNEDWVDLMEEKINLNTLSSE